MNLSLGWTRNVLNYLLARRYGNVDSVASTGQSPSFLTLEERNAFCEAHGLSQYRGGEVLPELNQDEAQQRNNVDEENNPRTTAIAESLLRAAFVCVSLGEEEYLLPLLEEVAA